MANEGGVKDYVTCPNCGAKVEADARFCTNCSEPLAGPPPEEEAAGIGDIKPWALKASRAVKRVPTGVKVGVPIAIVVIVAVVVALLVIASGHSPVKTVNKYLTYLKNTNYEAACGLVSSGGGRFSSPSYFNQWQYLQEQELGPLKEFTVSSRNRQNKFFGRLLAEDAQEGTPFVATLKYRDETYDVNMTAVPSGGTWPFNSYRLKLSDENSRALASPLGARVAVDDVFVGVAKEDKSLKEALTLGTMPKDVSGAIDYVKTLVRTANDFIDEFKGMVRKLDNVAERVQRLMDVFSTKGVSWSEVVDEANATVEASKQLASEFARAMMRIYWIFGGGNDGSLRAKLTRVQSEVNLRNLPEGYHVLTVSLPGFVTARKDLLAPDDVDVTLKPNASTRQGVKDAVNSYYRARTTALATATTAPLAAGMSGVLLDEETAKVQDLRRKNLRTESQLVRQSFGEIKGLSATVLTVETKETWNFNNFKGSTAVSGIGDVKQECIYTVQLEGGKWVTTERKVTKG